MILGSSKERILKTFFYVIFLFGLGVYSLNSAEKNELTLLCNWRPLVTLPERMKVFGLIFNNGQLDMLGIDARGQVSSSRVGAYAVDGTQLSWEGAPLFGRNTLDRHTLSSLEGGVTCEKSQSPTSLRSSLKVLGEEFRNKD